MTERPPVPVWQVDSFTTEPFRGNPAAVCLLDAPAPAIWMQSLAAEMNLSETAYVVPRDGAGDAGQFDLRWFTPTVEVDLCGHATLASAHVLLEQERIAPGAPISFHTRSGVLAAGGVAGRIEMDFPAYVPRTADVPPRLAAALGAEPVAYAEVADRGYRVIELEDAAVLRSLEPDFAAIDVCVGSISVTAASDDDRYDFVSRYFAPAAGIDEDPVTGSAHCVLGPYWSERLGRTRLVGYQASARGGVVDVELVSSADGDRALLTGDAVTVWSGTIDVPAEYV